MGSCGRYRSDQRILLVGDGDLSFSRALAKAFEQAAMGAHRAHALEEAGAATEAIDRINERSSVAQNLVVTTLDSETFLRKYYANAPHHASELQACGAQVHHNVDALTLESHHAVLSAAPFDCVVFNFPHPGWLKEQSLKKYGVRFGHEQCDVMIQRHRALLRGFFQSVLALAKRSGQDDIEAHVTTKVRPWDGSDWWQVTALAKECGLELVSESPFDGQPYVAFGYLHKYGCLKGEAGAWNVDASFPLGSAVLRVFRPRNITQ
eukprot:352020-Chlamydomonas_euryale.AAC.9